jgi:hypothetical protein
LIVNGLRTHIRSGRIWSVSNFEKLTHPVIRGSLARVIVAGIVKTMSVWQVWCLIHSKTSGTAARGRHSNLTGALRIGRADQGARSPQEEAYRAGTSQAAPRIVKQAGWVDPKVAPRTRPRRPTSRSFRCSILATHLGFLTRAQHRHYVLTPRGTPSRPAGSGHRRRLAQKTDFPPVPLRYEYGAGWPLGCARLATERQAHGPKSRRRLRRLTAPTIYITDLHQCRAQYSYRFVPQWLARLCTCKPS